MGSLVCLDILGALDSLEFKKSQLFCISHFPPAHDRAVVLKLSHLVFNLYFKSGCIRIKH